jgi:hypothetical protein
MGQRKKTGAISMKTNVLGKGGMRGALLLPILLSACAVQPQVSGAGAEAEKPSRQSVAAPQPVQQQPSAAPQKSVQPQQVPAQAQQPAPADQGSSPAPKPKHNVEED